MKQPVHKVEVTVEDVKESTASSTAGSASVVIQTESKVDGRLRDTSIEVLETDVPTMAAALLNADTAKPTTTADLPAAVQCLAVGVMYAAGAGQVRLHLQLDSGQVLPIEMSRDAAIALSHALSEHTGTR